MTPSIALRSPPPSIGLDGEPETIKYFAAKQHCETNLDGLNLSFSKKKTNLDDLNLSL